MDRARFAPEFDLLLDGPADAGGAARLDPERALPDRLRRARRSGDHDRQREIALARPSAVRARHCR